MTDKIITVNGKNVEEMFWLYVDSFLSRTGALNHTPYQIKEELLKILNAVADKDSEEYDFLDDFYGFLDGGGDEG